MKTCLLKDKTQHITPIEDVDYVVCDGGYECLVDKLMTAYDISREKLLSINEILFRYLPVVATNSLCLIEFFFADRYNFLTHTPVGTSLNIGASDGMTTILMGTFSDEVISIEPIEFFHDALDINSANMARVWGIKNSVYKCALGESDYQTQITLYEDCTPTIPPITSYTNVITGDSLNLTIDLIKVDAPHMVEKVLTGLENTIAKQHPEIYIALYDMTKIDDIIHYDWYSFLEEQKYNMIEFTRDYVRLV